MNEGTMEKLLRIWRSLLFLFRRSQMDQNLTEEIQFHIEMKTQEKRQAGMGEKEAEQAARREFGNALLLKEVSRELWGFCSFETFLQDIRYGLRMLRRNPGFTTVVILTLALGIGMNTAMFSVVNAVLFHPLVYPNADRLIWLANHDEYFKQDTWGSRADYLIWRDQTHSFESMTAYGNQDLALVAADQASQERIASITGDFW